MGLLGCEPGLGGIELLGPHARHTFIAFGVVHAREDTAFDLAVEALNHGGRLKPIAAPKMTAFGEFIARHHLGDPVSVADAWRPNARRERLYDQVRLDAQAAKVMSATSGR